MKTTQQICKFTICALLLHVFMVSHAFSQTKRIEATLLDSSTRQPIIHGKVLLSYWDHQQKIKIAEAYPDAKGHVIFPLLKEGTYQVSAQADGYRSRNAYGTFGKDESDFFIKLKLFLQPGNRTQN